MEDLPLRGVGRRSNFAGIEVGGQILDVGQNNVCRLVVVSVVLPATNRGDVRRDAGVDDHVLLARVSCHWHSSDNLESVTGMNFVGDGSQCAVQLWKRECLLADEAERSVER